MGLEHFINAHGALDLAVAYLLSALLSGLTAVPLPTGAGYWAQVGYHVASVLRGNLAQYLKQPGQSQG